ncbi:MAG: enoyl-CoA hydratase/isomerase family protein [Gammaproteobacteria bacterium]|nr:enoyl-CoA hydratase/isomerase family protein [Gammaproteobacteria bacterium]
MTVQYARQGHLATITLDRPEKLNAIDAATQVGLAQAWQRFELDEEAWIAILTGSGRAFCAGGDRSWFERIARGEDGLGEFLAGVNRDPYWSGRLTKPSIVAVEGMALGAGLDLVLRADLRVAAEDARFQLPEVDLGSIIVLWDNLPYALTAELLAGLPLDARRAHAAGLINRLAPPGSALACAEALAAELLAKPRDALRAALAFLREFRHANTIPSQNTLRERSTLIGRQLAAAPEWRSTIAATPLGKKADRSQSD